MMQTIEVIISPQGEAKIETRGFTGSSCQQASSFLERALGVKVSEKPTTEFYQNESQGEVLQQGGRP